MLPIDIKRRLGETHAGARLVGERGRVRTATLGQSRFGLSQLVDGKCGAIRANASTVHPGKRRIREAVVLLEAAESRRNQRRIGSLHGKRADGVLRHIHAVGYVAGRLLGERDHLLLGALIELLVDKRR